MDWEGAHYEMLGRVQLMIRLSTVDRKTRCSVGIICYARYSNKPHNWQIESFLGMSSGLQK